MTILAGFLIALLAQGTSDSPAGFEPGSYLLDVNGKVTLMEVKQGPRADRLQLRPDTPWQPVDWQSRTIPLGDFFKMGGGDRPLSPADRQKRLVEDAKRHEPPYVETSGFTELFPNGLWVLESDFKLSERALAMVAAEQERTAAGRSTEFDLPVGSAAPATSVEDSRGRPIGRWAAMLGVLLVAAALCAVVARTMVLAK